jgi:hypothetical protein
MKSTKEIFKVFLLLFAVFVISRATARYFFDIPSKAIEYSYNNTQNGYLFSNSKIDRKLNPEMYNIDNHYHYNFNNMIDLIELAQVTKKEYEPSFDQTISQKAPDIEVIRSLLLQLAREKSKLRNYIMELKGHSRAQLPLKTNNNLEYHSRVLDDAIVSIRALLAHEEKKMKNNA